MPDKADIYINNVLKGAAPFHKLVSNLARIYPSNITFEYAFIVETNYLRSYNGLILTRLHQMIDI